QCPPGRGAGMDLSLRRRSYSVTMASAYHWGRSYSSASQLDRSESLSRPGPLSIAANHSWSPCPVTFGMRSMSLAWISDERVTAMGTSGSALACCPCLRPCIRITFWTSPGHELLPWWCGNVRRERLLQRSEEHTSELQSRFDLVCR